MKKICVLCKKSRGKRACKLHKNAVICPPCCASIRHQACEGCRHYTAAQQYQASKDRDADSRHVVIEVNEDIEQAVEHALQLIEQRSFHRAEQMLQQLQDTHPRNHLVYYGLGILYAFQGQHDRAIANFEKAITIFPYFVEACYNRAVAYQKKLDIRNMITAYQHVIEIGDSGDECVHQAQDFLRGFEQHVREYEGVTLDEYVKGMTYFDHGVAYMTREEWERAIHSFQHCLRITPRHPQSYGNMGLCYAQIGQKALALEAFEHTLELDPEYELAIVNQAIVQSLHEGEQLPPGKMNIIEYYKDYPRQNKSYLEEFVHDLKQ